MHRYAVIDSSSVVTNIVIWDGTSIWEAPDGCTAVLSDDAGIGFTYKNGVFTPNTPVEIPEPSVEQQISDLKQQLDLLVSQINP
jgi:hypothetical protein